MTEKLSICRVKLELLPSSPSGELSEHVFRKCSFCNKHCQLNNSQFQLVEKLSGPDNFYCVSCLRHGFNTRGNRDILILSFRSIIGYFYLQNYIQAESGQKLWITQIENYIDAHQKTGFTNPLFQYDPETMLWFIDFSKVGLSKKKIHLSEILKTVWNILISFDLNKNIPEVDIISLYSKYKIAIESFYQKRYRPKNRRMLIPTLASTGASEPKTCSFDKLRNFILDDLKKY